MLKELNILHDSIYNDESTKNPDVFIQLFEENLSLIENANFKDYDEFFKTTRLYADYSINLVLTKNYKKSIPFLNKSLVLMEKVKGVKYNDLWTEPMYEHLIYNRSLANFNLGKKDLSFIDIRNLINHYPDNKTYLEIYNKFKLSRIYKLEWFFIIMIVLFIVLSNIFDPEDGILDILSLLFLILFIIGGSITYIIRIIRVKKTKPNKN